MQKPDTVLCNRMSRMGDPAYMFSKSIVLNVQNLTEYVLRERVSLTVYIQMITRRYHLAEARFLL